MKSKDVKTFIMRDIKSEEDLKKLQPEFNYKIFSKAGEIPSSYAVWASNCRVLIGTNHETREDMFDTLEHLFFFKSPTQEINPFVRIINHGGRLYEGHTYYFSTYNERYYENDFFNDGAIVDVKKQMNASSDAILDEVNKLYEDFILSKLDDRYLEVASSTVFDLCTLYNWAICEAPSERRLQFLKSFPNFYEFYQAFTFKYSFLSLYKVSKKYTVFRKDLNEEREEHNASIHYIFSDIEDMIENGESSDKIVDLVVANPPIKYALKDEEVDGKVWFDTSHPNAKFAFNAVAVDNIFNFTPVEYFKMSNFYDGANALLDLDPNYYHLFKGKYDELCNIKTLLNELGEIDDSMKMDINKFLGKCDSKYIDVMTKTHVDTLVNDVLKVIKRYTEMDSTKVLVERIANRNSMKMWYNLNEKYHQFAPYLSDFEYALCNVLNRCYVIPLSEDAKLFDQKAYDKTLKNIMKDVEVRQLVMVDDFRNEGDEMDHCVSGYYTNCVGRARFIFSFKVKETGERSTCEIRFDGSKFSVGQHYGVKNTRNYDQKLHDMGTMMCDYLTLNKELFNDISQLYANSENDDARTGSANDAKAVIMLTKFFVPQLFKDKHMQISILEGFRKEFDAYAIEEDKFESFMNDTIGAIKIKLGIPVDDAVDSDEEIVINETKKDSSVFGKIKTVFSL